MNTSVVIFFSKSVGITLNIYDIDITVGLCRDAVML